LHAATAVGADVLGHPVGLAIAVSTRDRCSAQLLSVVVAPSMRRTGIGAALVENLERELGMSGATGLSARIVEGEQSVAVACMLRRAGYAGVPEGSGVYYSARPLRLLESPGLAAACPDVEIIPFTTDLLDRVRPFGDADGFSPFALRAGEYQAAWSFLALRSGSIVGWILGHSDGDAARVSSLYTVEGHRSLRLAGFLIRTFVCQVARRGIGRVVWEVRLDHEAWRRLMDQLLARYSDERLVVHLLRKPLSEAARANGDERR
jgi:GNAT superfamily N-acetyltransferase